MAFPIQMTNRANGAHALGYSGFSWTCLFFGPFPALFRGHISAFFIMLALALVTIGFSGLVFMFTYNGWHYNWLMKKGFASSTAYQQNPHNIINVSVGNVGSADYSQQAHLHSGHSPSSGNAIPAIVTGTATIAENVTRKLHGS